MQNYDTPRQLTLHFNSDNPIDFSFVILKFCGDSQWVGNIWIQESTDRGKRKKGNLFLAISEDSCEKVGNTKSATYSC